MIETVELSNEAAACELLKRCSANQQSLLPYIPRAMPAQPARTVHYHADWQAMKVLEFNAADQVISVESGMRVAELAGLLAPGNQWFPVCVPDSMTLADLINVGRSGCLEHGFGPTGDLVLGLSCLLASGSSIKCGGKVVKNVTGYDMTRLIVGAHGSLGLPLSAHLRLYAMPERLLSLSFAFSDCRAAYQAAGKLRKSGLPLMCCEILSPELVAMIASAASAPPHSVSLRKFFADCGKSFQLVVQIGGEHSLVEDVKASLETLTGSAAFQLGEQDDASLTWFWKAASFPDQLLGACIIELAAGGVRLLELESLLPGYVARSLRPGRNRLFLWPGDDVVTADLFDRLSKQIASGEQASMAASTQQYIWQVVRSGIESAPFAEMAARIKREFDPESLLNPLVVL